MTVTITHADAVDQNLGSSRLEEATKSKVDVISSKYEIFDR